MFGGPPNNDVPQKSGGNTPGVLAGVDMNNPEPDDGNIGPGIGAANNPPLAAETVDASGEPVPNGVIFTNLGFSIRVCSFLSDSSVRSICITLARSAELVTPE